MPKVKRIRSAALVTQNARHAPLGQVIQADENRSKYAAVRGQREKKGRKNGNTDNDGDGDLIDAKTSRKILELSREQQLEMEAEEQLRYDQKRQQQQQQREKKSSGRKGHDNDDDEDDDGNLSVVEESVDNENDDDDEDQYVQETDGYVDLAEDALGLSAEDEAAVAAMMGGGQHQERRTLADMILEKIAEKESEQRGEMAYEEDEFDHGLPPKVVEVYSDIGVILGRYTSGKLPKAFKVIPSLSNWEEVLYLTRPDLWTPQAMFAATRIFASNLNPKMAQRFYNLVLLDAVRADIVANKKLNYHYYMSLKKAIYKPAAFFKGILLPLCKEECSLREAVIVASVLQRVSIPMHHSAVAVHKLAQLEYSGAASIFIKTLLNKKYSLPAPVITSLVQYFSKFLDVDDSLPVLWHQAFLVFVQRYKNELKDKAKESFKVLMRKHFHHKITPEIRRELFAAQAYRDERAVAMET